MAKHQLLAGHPRHELHQDEEALGRVALIADELAGIAEHGLHIAADIDNEAVDIDPDPEAAERIKGEAVVLRNYEKLCKAARESI